MHGLKEVICQDRINVHELPYPPVRPFHATTIIKEGVGIRKSIEVTAIEIITINNNNSEESEK